MYVPLSSFLDRRDPNLPKHDRPIRRRPAPHEHQVLLDVKVSELLVRESVSAPEHLGLVLVPVVTQFDELMLDLVFDDFEGLDCLWEGCVRLVEVDCFAGCWVNSSSQNCFRFSLIY